MGKAGKIFHCIKTAFKKPSLTFTIRSSKVSQRRKWKCESFILVILLNLDQKLSSK